MPGIIALFGYDGPMPQNQEQIGFWNGPRAALWVAHQELMDRQLEPFGAAVLGAAQIQPAERVIDIGCGCGGTTLAIAQAVGPTGSVLGVDISQPMITRARERTLRLSQVRLEQADATTFAFDGQADVVTSRFGVMFFEEPRASFSNLRRALRPGGRIAFICWRSLAENEWMNVPLTAAAQVVPPAGPPAAPDAPGPYSLSDQKRVFSILEESGFTQAAVTPFDHVISVGKGEGLDAATEEALTLGPTARLLLEAPVEAQTRARAAVREALAQYLRGSEVQLRAAAWLVTARA